MVERILNEADLDAVRKMDVYSDIYIHTELATKIIAESYEKIEQVQKNSFEEAINLIMDDRMDDAFRMICKKNAERPVSQGLGCDWGKWYEEGIEDAREKIYSQQIKTSDDKMITAATIYAQMSGESERDVQEKVKKTFEDKENAHLRMRTISSELSTERNFEAYRSAGIKEYQFLATLDMKTCPVCAKLDGRIFRVSKMEMGVNCPPMHEGCRCTTVSVVDRKYMEGSTRSATDPVTRRSIHVPRTMRYKDWYKEYVKGKEHLIK